MCERYRFECPQADSNLFEIMLGNRSIDSLYTILCAMVLTYDPIRLSWRSSMGLMANPELAHIRYGMEYWLSSPNISCSLPESMPRFRLCKTGL